MNMGTKKNSGKNGNKRELHAARYSLINVLRKILNRKSLRARNEFRYNNLTDHPNYVFEEENGKTKSVGITHGEKTFGKKNMPLKKNPQKGKEKEKAYIRNGVISQKTKYYGKETLSDFEFAPEDMANVKSKIRNYKKRRKQHKKSKKKGKQARR